MGDVPVTKQFRNLQRFYQLQNDEYERQAINALSNNDNYMIYAAYRDAQREGQRRLNELNNSYAYGGKNKTAKGSGLYPINNRRNRPRVNLATRRRERLRREMNRRIEEMLALQMEQRLIGGSFGNNPYRMTTADWEREMAAYPNLKYVDNGCDRCLACRDGRSGLPNHTCKRKMSMNDHLRNSVANDI